MSDPAPVPASAPWTVALTSIASLMVALDLLVVSTALSSIRHDLGAPMAQLQWTVTAYGLTFACLLMTGAALGDRFGRRRIFILGLVTFAAASAACATATGIEWLIAARAVQGAGAALVLPLAVTLLSSSVSPAGRGRALGVFEGVTGLGTIAGPPTGGIVAFTVGWEFIFWINVPIVAGLVPLVLRRVPESRGPDAALDLRGLLLVSGAGFALVWGTVRGNSAGWTSPTVLTALVAATALAAVFVGWERRHATPMLPLGLFGCRTFSAGVAAGFLGFGALYSSVFFLAQFVQNGLGYTALEAGLGLMPWTATLLVVAPLAGVLADRVGDRPVLVTGLALQAGGLSWLALLVTPEVSYATLIGPLVVAGIGASAAIPVVQNAILGGVAPDAIGKASGVNTAAQELGGVVGVALLVAVFAATGSLDSPSSFTAGFTAALWACAGLAAAATAAALLLPRAQHSDPAGTDGSGRSTATPTARSDRPTR